MGSIKHFLQKQPTLTPAIISLFAAAISLFVKQPALAVALTGVFAAFLGVHQVVTPVTTMVEKVTDATTTAATEVAKSLDETTVGVAGELSNGAQEIVDHVIDLTVGSVLGKNGEK